MVIRFFIFILSLFLFFGCTKDDIITEMKEKCIYDAIISDIDGNVYNTIIIGTQFWMAENLKTTKYNNGTIIKECNDDSLWSVTTEPALCFFNSPVGNEATSGYIYNGYAIDHKGLCPLGWHVPEDEEWVLLFETVGGVHIAGKMLKESGTDHWVSPNIGSTNEYCFSALPCSGRDYTGQFYNYNSFACWWTSTLHNNYYYTYRIFSIAPGVIKVTNQNKNYGYPVRCIKDK